MGECFLNRIIKQGTTAVTGYVRPAGAINGDTIAANAVAIESGGTTYEPIYVIVAKDTVASATFSKTGTGVATGADAFLFSDEPSTLYVGNTAHTFDPADDVTTSDGWNCRYVIMYATAANKAAAVGVTVNIYAYRATYEIVACSGTIFSATSAISGSTIDTDANQNFKYVNLENATFYKNAIAPNNFLMNSQSMEECRFPNSLLSVTGQNFLGNCYSLKKINLESLTSISGVSAFISCQTLTEVILTSLASITGNGAFPSCKSLSSINLPALITLSGGAFGNCPVLKTVNIPVCETIDGANFSTCRSLKYFEIPSTVTTITTTSSSSLGYCQYIKLYEDFDISACNFTGATGYSKSVAWFNHLATQLKDNSGGTAKTMVIGAENLALMAAQAPDAATAIAAKNWTLS